MKKLKRVVIKEELVALTKDYKLAIVLNQMLYWSERVKDFDQFILEEKERMKIEHRDSEHLSCRHGWIFKTAAQLADECMMTHSDATMRRYLDELVKNGWLMQRKNPVHKWDKTLQYRVNVHKIQADLQKIGYALEGYPLTIGMKREEEGISFLTEKESHLVGAPVAQSMVSNRQNKTCIQERKSNDTPTIPRYNSDHQRVFQYFEKHPFGSLTKGITESISTWIEQLPEDIVIKAMETSLQNGKRNWNYVQAVLQDWKKKGLKTVSQVEEYLEQRGNPSHVKFKRKEVVPKWLNEEDKEPVLDEAFYEEKRCLEERIKAYKQRKMYTNRDT